MRASDLDPWPVGYQPPRDRRHGPISKVALAKIDSKVAIRRLQRLKLCARVNPPRAARGQFPFNHRTMAEVRSDQIDRLVAQRAEEARVDRYWDERWSRHCDD